MRSKGRSPRSTLSVNGRVELRRRRWQAQDGGGDSPLDRLLDAAGASISLGARELCCRLGIAGGSFARAAENLKHAAKISISEETLRQVVEGEGKVVLEVSQDEQLEIDWSAAECKTATPQGQEVSRVYASADGVLVPVTTSAEKLKRRQTVVGKRRQRPRRPGTRRPRLGAVKAGADQRYKQIYVTAFYDQEQDRRLVGVTRKDHRGLGKLLRREASRLRLRAADERLGLIDGAVCLRKHMECLPLTAVGLDFYHLSGHVHEGRRQTFGPEAQAGQQWAGRMLHTVKHEGYEPFWEQLADWRGRQRGGKRCWADKLLHYVAERREMIHYDEAQRRGWHIGSGPIEAMCKATTRRLKGPGMRWDADNAEAVMALESLYQSNLWDRYWTNALNAPWRQN